jgi:hypothetical protein
VQSADSTSMREAAATIGTDEYISELAILRLMNRW